MSRARGLAEVSLPRLGASHRDRSRRRASPQPDRLGHLLSPPVSSAGWSCLRRGSALWGALSRACLTGAPKRSASPGVAAFAGPFGTGPPHAFPREGERAPLHPRCLPSLDNPCRGSPRRPQAVPSLWSNEADAFSILALPGPLTRLRGTRGLGRACVRPASKSRAHHHIDRSASEQLLRSVRSAA